MKLSAIVIETKSDSEPDPFALEEVTDYELKSMYNDKGKHINEIIDRDLQTEWAKASERYYGWCFVRQQIENATLHNPIIAKAALTSPSTTNEYHATADKSNRINIGVSSIDVNLVPEEYRPWLYEQKAKADRAMKESEVEREAAEALIKKVSKIQRSLRAKAAKKTD